MVHPRSVNVVKLDGRVVDEDSLRSVQLFCSLSFHRPGATLLVSVDNFSFGTTFTAVVSCIGNVGPGLELVGPMGNYSAFSPSWCSPVYAVRAWRFCLFSFSLTEMHGSVLKPIIRFVESVKS